MSLWLPCLVLSCLVWSHLVFLSCFVSSRLVLSSCLVLWLSCLVVILSCGCLVVVVPRLVIVLSWVVLRLSCLLFSGYVVSLIVSSRLLFSMSHPSYLLSSRLVFLCFVFSCFLLSVLCSYWTSILTKVSSYDEFEDDAFVFHFLKGVLFSFVLSYVLLVACSLSTLLALCKRKTICTKKVGRLSKKESFRLIFSSSYKVEKRATRKKLMTP